MQMSNKYLLLSNGPKRVYLISEDGQFNVELAGRTVAYPESIERLWLYLLLQKNDYQEFALQVRSSVKFELTPVDIDRCRLSFIRAHRIENADHYSFSLLHKQASRLSGLLLPIPGDSCIISHEHEETLMRILIENPNEVAKEKISRWFRGFCKNYGYDLERKFKGKQYDYLMESFLEQEGIDPSSLPKANLISTKQEQRNQAKGYVLLFIVIGSFLVIGGLLIAIGNKMTSYNNWGWGGMLLLLIGFLLLSVPFIFINSNK